MEGQLKAQDTRPEYPLGVPGKFDADGNVQAFPGNTIIAHLSPSSPLYGQMLSLYEKLKQSHLSPLLAMLPPSSWHMTIFEGVCNQVRKPGFWPSDLPIDATLETCNSHFEKKLSSFNLGSELPYQMSATGFDPLEIGIGISLHPRTQEERERLRDLRSRLAEELKIRHPGHDSYGLHFSIAYLLRHLTEEQHRDLTALLRAHFEKLPFEFELGPPEFCHFENMFAFKRVLYLKSQTS